MINSSRYTLIISPSSTTTKNSLFNTENIPIIPNGKTLTRLNYFQAFVDQQYDTLQHLYNIIFDTESKQRITLIDWIHFAFDQTSTHGLQSYK